MIAKLMACGCAPNGKILTADGELDGCITHGCIDFIGVDLSNRKAKCIQGRHAIEDSDPENMAFFQYKPDKEFDEYYCGCRGWD